jgi:hypothetical protein
VLSGAQQETESKIISVALAQPRRRGLPSCQRADSWFFVSEFGKFFRPIIAATTITARARPSGDRRPV